MLKLDAPTQNKRILRWLAAGRWLTPRTAQTRFGCMRLAARVNDLRGEGHNIKRRMRRRNGTRFASYRLA